MYGESDIALQENSMKTIRIRKFTILSLFFILQLPWIFLIVAHYIETNTFRFERTDSQQKKVNETIHQIETNTEKWTESTWQNQIKNYLQKANMNVSILTESNKTIFQSDSTRELAFKSTKQFSIIQDGKVKGRVVIYQSNSRAIEIVAALIGLILAFFIIGLMMRQFIIKPLEQFSLGSRKIALGDLDVRLPSSRITEIEEVRESFTAMVTGLKESFQNQVKLENERRFVIAAVAHDLRTPLFALRGYLEGLEQGIARTPEKVSKYVAVCKEKSAQLDRLVEDLFTFTKTEYFEMKLKQENVDLSQILKNLIDTLKLPAQQKNISIIEQKFEKHCMISGDLHLLERAINNLLDNAVRHTPRNGEIVVQCYKDHDKIIFTIQDTGIGFLEKELSHVFEPLFRGEASRNRSTGGTGLGLTISQRIIKQHGGDLVAGNHCDGGALLRGWIPLQTHSSN